MEGDVKPADAAKTVGAALGRAPLFTWVPKGMLTQSSSWVQGLVGIVLLVGVAFEWIQTGMTPNVEDLDLLLGVLFTGNAATGMGLARKIDPES